MSDFRDMAENHAIFESLKKNIKLIEHKHIKDQLVYQNLFVSLFKDHFLNSAKSTFAHVVAKFSKYQ